MHQINSGCFKTPKKSKYAVCNRDIYKHLYGGIHFLYKDGIEIDFVTKDFLLEAKFGQEMNEKQKKLFNNYKIKKKIIAKDFSFFM